MNHELRLKLVRLIAVRPNHVRQLNHAQLKLIRQGLTPLPNIADPNQIRSIQTPEAGTMKNQITISQILFLREVQAGLIHVPQRQATGPQEQAHVRQPRVQAAILEHIQDQIQVQTVQEEHIQGHHPAVKTAGTPIPVLLLQEVVIQAELIHVLLPATTIQAGLIHVHLQEAAIQEEQVPVLLPAAVIPEDHTQVLHQEAVHQVAELHAVQEEAAVLHHQEVVAVVPLPEDNFVRIFKLN